MAHHFGICVQRIVVADVAWRWIEAVERFPSPFAQGFRLPGHSDTVCATMPTVRVVLDTNVLVSAFRSREGVAFRLFSLLRDGRFEISVSVPLVLEYEDVLRRGPVLSEEETVSVLSFLCSVAHRQKIFFLWRPGLPDPKDDMVLELAVASRARYIVTYNGRDFAAAERFGIQAVTPKAFLDVIGG
ncbi:MAG TPA: putative toxin-antitoxin system toxin component, PIN family [Thermoanaerobaculia bacterium]|nr:putative toxin-antitoxin system toxin component, PIN family [Thermoanaerobaculia bacterium]